MAKKSSKNKIKNLGKPKLQVGDIYDPFGVPTDFDDPRMTQSKLALGKLAKWSLNGFFLWGTIHFLFLDHFTCNGLAATTKIMRSSKKPSVFISGTFWPLHQLLLPHLNL